MLFDFAFWQFVCSAYWQGDAEGSCHLVNLRGWGGSLDAPSDCLHVCGLESLVNVLSQDVHDKADREEFERRPMMKRTDGHLEPMEAECLERA